MVVYGLYFTHLYKFMYIYGYEGATGRIFLVLAISGLDKTTAITRGGLAAICDDPRLMIVPKSGHFVRKSAVNPG